MLLWCPVTLLLPLKDFPMILSWLTPCSFSLTQQNGNAVYRLVRRHGLASLLFSFLIFREKLLGVTVFMLGEFRGKRRNLSSYIEITFNSYFKKILAVSSSSILGLLVLKLCMCDCEREVLCVCLFCFLLFLFIVVVIEEGNILMWHQ